MHALLKSTIWSVHFFRVFRGVSSSAAAVRFRGGFRPKVEAGSAAFAFLFPLDVAFVAGIFGALAAGLEGGLGVDLVVVLGLFLEDPAVGR
jgi:hypothetical protein